MSFDPNWQPRKKVAVTPQEKQEKKLDKGSSFNMWHQVYEHGRRQPSNSMHEYRIMDAFHHVPEPVRRTIHQDLVKDYRERKAGRKNIHYGPPHARSLTERIRPVVEAIKYAPPSALLPKGSKEYRKAMKMHASQFKKKVLKSNKIYKLLAEIARHVQHI